MKQLTLCALFMFPNSSLADTVQIEDVQAQARGDTWNFSVTLRHPDTGWDHYADGWEVLAPDGSQLGYRELAHPHVNEQPFTRSLSGVAVPAGIETITVRAKCSVDGWTSEPFEVSLVK